MYRCHDCLPSSFDQLWQVARSYPFACALFCCWSILFRCILPMPVTRTACPFSLSAAIVLAGAASACRVSASSVRLVRSRSGCAAAYASALCPGLDASAGVPLGKRCTLSALDPLPVGLVLSGLGSSRAERALARAVGFRPRRIRSAQRCRVVRRPCHVSVARLCALLGG